jgi:hypothetical protein
MKPGGMLELSEETEEITEEDPCCVSALLGCLANAPVAVGSTLHAIACTAESRLVLTSTMLRACFGLWDRKDREGMLIARLPLQWSFFQVLLALRASQQLGEVSVLLL